MKSLDQISHEITSSSETDITQIKEKSIKSILFISSITAIIVIFSIIFFLLKDAIPLFEIVNIWDFLAGGRWNPTGKIPLYGAFPLIVGTLMVTLGAMVIAIPLSIGSAIFISELASEKIRSFVKPAIELLAGIPSVVYGFFGLIVLTDWLRVTFDQPTGESLIAGSILLGIMAIPTITSVAEDAINAVPRHFKEGSLALGATRWQTISKVIAPSALSGITAAIILGIGRAVGETMAVMMVCGNPPYGLIPDPLWDVFTPVKTLTATLGIEMGEVAYLSNHYHALFGIAILLLSITLIINISATVILDRLKQKHVASGHNKKKKNRKKFFSKETQQRIISIIKPLLMLFVLYILYLMFGLIMTAAIVILTILATFAYKKIDAKKREKVAFGGLFACIIVILIFLGIILFYIISNGLGALSWEFLTQEPSDAGVSGGIFPAIIGTLYLVAGAIAIALPIGVGAATYLVEYTREGKATKIIRTGADLLNGTPSIVFGLFGFAFLVLALGFGRSLIAGQITLAFMIIPTIVRTTEEALKSVPQSMREGSFALGATRWQTISRVVLPPAAPGVITGAILGIGRAAGETAPLLFTAAAFSGIIPSSLFEPVNSLPYHLFVLSTNIPGSKVNQAGTALVLLLLVLGVYLIAIIIRNYYQKTMKW
jgi:phosphate transport system permease protein